MWFKPVAESRAISLLISMDHQIYSVKTSAGTARAGVCCTRMREVTVCEKAESPPTFLTALFFVGPYRCVAYSIQIRHTKRLDFFE
jgi:hypothetical protein